VTMRKLPFAIATALGIAIGGGAWAYAATGSSKPPPLPPQKQQLLQAAAAHLAKARADAPAKTRMRATLPQVVQANSWIPGTYQTGQESQLAGLVETGEWQGIVRGIDVAVLAGTAAVDSSGKPNSVGRIVVQTVTASNPDGTFVPYANPALPGPYRIVSASGAVITLSAGNGAAFTFDANDDTFGHLSTPGEN